jgi:hypothetical protein
MLYWYTEKNGRLCLGTLSAKFANFFVATDITLNEHLRLPLLPEHIDLIGSFPEEWCLQDDIEKQINAAARHLFAHVEQRLIA